MHASSSTKSELERLVGGVDLRELFEKDPNRFEKLSLEIRKGAEFLLLDYSKNLVDDGIMKLLVQLAREAKVEEWRERMFNGDLINFTEQRAALHVALRDPDFPDEQVRRAVQSELEKIKSLTESIRSGRWRGFGGKEIRHVVNIGIGGSDLGPSAVYEALRHRKCPEISADFVSNVDSMQLGEVLRRCDHESTLFVVVSKTFTTQETMANAALAKRWLLERYGNAGGCLANHFVAVSMNESLVESFGIPRSNTLTMWDWVGGRYSVWSAVGFSVCVAIGFDSFREFLNGGHFMDTHFREQPLDRNIPVVMALLGVWYGNFLGAESLAIVPYEQALHRFPAHLQQLDMESNGKAANRYGTPVEYSTGPVVWGEPGTNGQHAFFQLLHQGTRLVPVDLMVGMHAPSDDADHESHSVLAANCFAQSEALMRGRSLESVLKESPEHALHRAFPGNRPSTTILYGRLSPFILGMLLSLYEHKVFVQGVIWGVNSFDQWGVELGKKLATVIHKEIREGAPVSSHDSSTNGLINLFLQSRRETK